jgi:hypothetical protein
MKKPTEKQFLIEDGDPKLSTTNVLLHPEILASKPKDGTTLPQQKAFLSFTVSVVYLNHIAIIS